MTCGMIKPHHPDCECETCKANVDVTCTEPAVGMVADSKTRVCASCARKMEDEGFAVERDISTGGAK